MTLVILSLVVMIVLMAFEHMGAGRQGEENKQYLHDALIHANYDQKLLEKAMIEALAFSDRNNLQYVPYNMILHYIEVYRKDYE